jgi:hypothetical protein
MDCDLELFLDWISRIPTDSFSKGSANPTKRSTAFLKFSLPPSVDDRFDMVVEARWRARKSISSRCRCRDGNGSKNSYK